ncbi:transmembrane protein 18-like isoform X2 [Physella acuta]|uniref:transmembrane protein 18-like isoform X2 n=1 Tax=Physella acuta TaxID=109671 RepID=UPI0027DD3AA2|nr:transmembrane protein 18-like isoform X2 [Physella acuta]
MEPIKTTRITGIYSYLETVDWSDPWFTGLFTFHIFTFVITFITRRKQMIQAAHFIILLLLVYCAETLNEQASLHWKLFSKQQYFDSQGMFISIVWSAPLLLNCLVIVMIWILTSSQLIVSTGRLKLEAERRAKEKKKD